MFKSLLNRKSFVSCVTLFALFAGGNSFAASASVDINQSYQYRIRSTEPELRRWEFRTAPIALAAKWYTLDVSYRLNENFAMGPAAVMYDDPGPGGMLAPSYKGQALGWNATYYFRPVTSHSMYLSTHAYSETYTAHPHGTLTSEDTKGFRGNAAVGYHWKWARFNLLVGGGEEYTDHSITKKYDPISGVAQQAPEDSKETKWTPFLEVKVGIEI